MRRDEILNYFNYPVYGPENCNEPLISCPGKFQCWNFNHHINELKNFIASRRFYQYQNSICNQCFFIMYVDLARMVYMSRKALNVDFLRGAYQLYVDLYELFLKSKNPSSYFRSHFFYILFDNVSKFIQAHSDIQYGFAVEVNVMYYNIVEWWMKCSPTRLCLDHS